MRRFLFVATLLALLGMTTAVADDESKSAAGASESKMAIPAIMPATRITAVSNIEEELEILIARRMIRKGYWKSAEIDVKNAKAKADAMELKRFLGLGGSISAEAEIDKAKQDLELANAQLEIKSGELKEIEVKIKYARIRLEEAKSFAALMEVAKELEVCGEIIGVVALRGIPVLRGVSQMQQPAVPATAGSRIAVFNMAAVMKQYERAKYKVGLLNEERKRLTVDVTSMREDYSRLQKEIQAEQNLKRKEELSEHARELARQIEDADRRINKQLSGKADVIIEGLYDDIKAVVDKLKDEKGYDIVFAYPDATSPEEAKLAYVKELKLKPPAAHPFAISKGIDLTDEIIKELNTHYPPQPNVVHRRIE